MQKWVVLIFFALFVNYLRAQEADQTVNKHFTGNAELGLVQNSGNANNESFSTAAELKYQAWNWEHTFKGNYIRQEAQKVTTSRIMNLSLKSDRELSKKISVFVRGEYFQNRFAGILDRYSLDLGPSYKILTGVKHKLRLDISAGLVDETRSNQTVNPGIYDNTELTFVSGDSTLVYEWQFSKNSKITEEVKYIHNFENSDDWRFNNIFSLVTTMTEIFSLKLSHTLIRFNRPAEGNTPTDKITSIALVANF